MSKESQPTNAMTMTWQGEPATYLISTVGDLSMFMRCCPHSQTLEAWSQKYGTTVWIPLPCKQWSCRMCAAEKVRRLAAKTQKAAPNRMMTLTVDPAKWDNPRHAFDGTRRKVPELFRKLRLKHKEAEYLRVTELTKGGWPHYHCLVRSPYLPHPQVKALWQTLTGAVIVDVRQVKDHWKAYTYLVKYLMKMHKIAWTERHVSYSKNFFPPDEDTVDGGLELSDIQIVEAHPARYLHAMFRKATLTEIGYNVFAIDPPQTALQEATGDPWLKDTTPNPVISAPPNSTSKPALQSCLFSELTSREKLTH